MAGLMAFPPAMLGLMGRMPGSAPALMPPQPPPMMADAGDEWFINPQGRPQGGGVPVLQDGQIGFDVSQPAQRGRVNPLNVLFRGLAPNLSGALDMERARLQAEADAPRMAMIDAENERIARALGPQALLAFRTNKGALGEGLAAQYKPTTTAAGGVSSVFGTGQQVEAPRVLEFGNDLVQAGPLSGVRTLGTRGPSYAEQAQIGRLQQDAAQAEARLNLDYQRLGQDETQFQQRLAYDQSKQESRPLSAAQQRQVETYYQDLASLDSVGQQVGSYINLIDSGQLNFSPTANLSGRVRNALGVSSENSRNQALFRSDMERLRNESLRLNTGVQTEGDAQRAWNELFGNLNDERVVRAQLKRIQDLNERAKAFRQNRLEAIEGQSFGQTSGRPQGSSAPPPPPGFVLD